MAPAAAGRKPPARPLIPLFILWLGLGQGLQIAMIVLGTSPVIGVTIVAAIKNVPPVYIRTGLVLGANRRTICKSIVLPSITRHLLGAVQVGSTWRPNLSARRSGSGT